MPKVDAHSNPNQNEFCDYVAYRRSNMILPTRIANKTTDPATAPLLIGLGLALLIVSGYWPAPVMAALGFIILGATLATIDRFSNSPALPSILVIHSLTYSCVYALFLGALLHSANRLSPFHVIDIASSGLLISIAAERVLAGLRCNSRQGR
jgi:hypothetical protein